MCRAEEASYEFGYREFRTETLVEMKPMAESLVKSLEWFGGFYSKRLAVAKAKFEAICWELAEREKTC